MKKKIIDFMIEKNSGVTFVDLENGIDGFKEKAEEGKYVNCYGNDKYNHVYWIAITNEAIEAITSLLRSKKIEMNSFSTTHLCYVIDGKTLKMPVAKRANWKYKEHRWVPVEFRIKR